MDVAPATNVILTTAQFGHDDNRWLGVSLTNEDRRKSPQYVLLFDGWEGFTGGNDIIFELTATQNLVRKKIPAEKRCFYHFRFGSQQADSSSTQYPSKVLQNALSKLEKMLQNDVTKVEKLINGSVKPNHYVEAMDLIRLAIEEELEHAQRKLNAVEEGIFFLNTLRAMGYGEGRKRLDPRPITSKDNSWADIWSSEPTFTQKAKQARKNRKVLQ